MAQIRRAAAAAAIVLLCLDASAADDPRALENPCAGFVRDQQTRRPRTPAERLLYGRPFLYNGVDDLAAPLDRPLQISSEYAKPYQAACVIFEVRYVDRGGHPAVAQATPRMVYPNKSGSVIPAIQRTAEDILRKLPIERVARRRPDTQSPQLVAIPLWPSHPLYTNDRKQIAGPMVNELQEFGYGNAERIARDGDVSVYFIWEQVNRNQLMTRFVVIRDIPENQVLVTMRPARVNTPIGPMDREIPEGPVGTIFTQTLAPWLERRIKSRALRVPTVRAEVRHYARGFRIPYDDRNAEANVPFVTDPNTNRPTEHPVLVAMHVGAIRGPGAPVDWDHMVSTPYATIADLRLRLEDAHMSREERARRAQERQAAVLAAQQREQQAQDARQDAARAQLDSRHPLSRLGYPGGQFLFREGRTSYYLVDLVSPTNAAIKVRSAVAVHDIGENDPVIDFVTVGDGDVRYSDRRIEFVRSRLLSAALKRWPDLTWFNVHHHVSGMPLADTAEFRRAGSRAYGFIFDQPVFQEEYQRDAKTNVWSPRYDLDRSRPRLVDLSLREYGRTVAEARSLRESIQQQRDLERMPPDQREAVLTARRAATRRSPNYVYKSDRFWASLPRFYIPEQTFNGDFDKFQVNYQFPRHFVEFVHAYSRFCHKEIEATRNYRKVTIVTQQVTMNGYGNVISRGAPEVTTVFIPGAFIDKYDDYSVKTEIAMAKQIVRSLFMDSSDAALIGAKVLTTPPSKLVDSIVFARQGSQGEIGELLSDVVGLTYSWNHFFASTHCGSATVYQMRENLLRVANSRPSLQKAGIAVANARAESEPLVPPPAERTVFDACYANHEFKEAELCICMDLRGEKVMTAAEKRRYSQNFQRFYEEIVFPTKSRQDDPRWRLYELHRQCSN